MHRGPPGRRPIGLLLRGPYRSPTGYGQHTRSLARALPRFGVEVDLVDDPSFSPLVLNGDLAVPRQRRRAPPLASLQVTLPTMAVSLEAPLRLLFSMFEGTCIPPAWNAASRIHDAIVVPTLSSVKAWCAAGFPAERLRICPLGVDLERFHSGVSPLSLRDRRGRSLTDYRVRVLTVAEVMPRKNLPGLVRAWLRATHPDDDAVLIVKLSGLGPVSALTLFQAVEEVEREVGRRREQAAPIVWLTSVLSDEEMPKLFALATHYASLSFGEGWDLPMLQAGVMGCKLLAPAHSAYLAYLDDRAARLLPVRESPTSEEGDVPLSSVVRGARAIHALFAGAHWWKPDEEAAVAGLRDAVSGQGDWPSDPARLQRHSWAESARCLATLLDELTPERGVRRSAR